MTTALHGDGVDLRVDGVSCRRGGREILSGVNLSVQTGSRMAIVGPNGTGKTTLLRTLAGLTPPAAGEVRVGGDDLFAMPARRRARLIALVAQEEQPSGELTVGEAVELGRTPHRSAWSIGTTDTDTVVDDALRFVGLDGWQDRSCLALSGGERHRVLLARALAQQTPMLVLDEPTNHLDIAWRLRLMTLLGALESTVVAAMHDLDLVLRHFDSVAVISDGGIRAHGAPIDVLTPELLSQVFGVDGSIVDHPVTGQPHLLLTEPYASPAEIPSPTEDRQGVTR